jgi:hypothetical protein
MRVYVADAYAHVQRLVSVVKMRPCLRSILPKSSVLLCVSLGRRTQCKGYSLKKYFLFTVASVCRVKKFHNCLKKFSQRRSKDADDALPGAEVAETTFKRFLCCGFRRTGKAMGQVYQCWWRICREINVSFFSVSNITCYTSYT